MLTQLDILDAMAKVEAHMQLSDFYKLIKMLQDACIMQARLGLPIRTLSKALTVQAFLEQGIAKAGAEIQDFIANSKESKTLLDKLNNLAERCLDTYEIHEELKYSSKKGA